MNLNKVARHKELCDKIHDIYEQKNHDYGDSFGKTIRKWGISNAGARLEDKLNRFETLIKGDAEVADESLIDTLLDMANYALMTVMEIENNERLDR